jgi:hypothetical protein
MRKWMRRTIYAGAAVALLLQLTNPKHVKPQVTPGHDVFAGSTAPPEVVTLIHNACYDCHSSQTAWPWYSYVAPVSWFVVGHINGARQALNFSEWPHDNPQRARKKWNHVSDELESGDMPLASYTWMHAKARLDGQQRQQLIKWAKAEAQRLAAAQ